MHQDRFNKSTPERTFVGKLRQKLRRIYHVLTTGHAGVTDELRAEMQTWFFRYQAELRRTTAITTFGVTLFGACAMAVLAPPEIKAVCVGVFFGQSFNHFAYLFLLRMRIVKEEQWFIALYTVVTQLVNVFGFGSITAVAAANHNLDPAYQTIGMALYATFTMLICDANKFIYGVGIIGGILHVIGAAYVWDLAGYDHKLAWCLVIAGVDVYIYAYNLRRLGNIWAQARASFEAHRLELQNEKLRLAAVESELGLARDLQESFGPPPEALRIGTMEIDFYHVPYGILGGDWYAVRKLSTGEVAVAVADVTGKGVPAAMVVQAIQSLWVYALGEREFEPISWLNSVNRTLMAMGPGQRHTTTLGLMILSSTTVTYYSAGHVPLYLVGDINDVHSVEPILSRGNLLGIVPEISITPIKVDLPPTGDFAVMLGTDGVFDWSLRRGRRQVLNLIKEIRKKGKVALTDLGSPDDKILVHVRKIG